MDSDFSDILGDPNFPRVREQQYRSWTSRLFGVKSAFVVFVLLVLYLIGLHAWHTFQAWRERSYKLSLRRRHGIPDSDGRPFNVAYAAVIIARQQEEEDARNARFLEVFEATTPPEIRQRHASPAFAQTIRPTTILGRQGPFGAFSQSLLNSSGRSPPASSNSHRSAQEHYNHKPVVRIAEPEVIDSPPKSGSSRRPIRKHTTIPIDDERRRKFDDDESDLSDHVKKTRNGGREYIDVDQYDERLNKRNIRPRGWKRVLGDAHEEDPHPSAHTRDKRQRQFSNEKIPEQMVEEMDVDEEDDEVGELTSSVRGKKRGRRGSGSVQGGDDDSAHEAEAEASQALRRDRKRRTGSKKKSDVAVSADDRKRDRDVAGSESDPERDVVAKNKSKKRGKKYSSPEQDNRSDASMDSLRGKPKRAIGEEWESNGVRYKLGSDGQRLRQTLVRKARPKYIMPQDSQHPDRLAYLEVYVETWLTEAEYTEAKDKRVLAWQDSNKPSPSAEPSTPPCEPQKPPPTTGKDLLWKSTPAGTPASSRHATPPGTQPAFTLVNPFEHPQPSKAGKRVSSAPRSVINGVVSYSGSPISPNLVGSFNGNPRYRTYSKWEKQELEANAMMKIRQAGRKTAEEKAQKLKEEQEEVEKLKKAQEAVAFPVAVPTITVTKAEEAKAPETNVSSFSFGPTPGTGPSKNDLTFSSDLQTKGAEKPATMFSFPSQPQTSPKPTVGIVSNQQSTAPSSFGFPAPATSAPTPAFSNITSSNAAPSQPSAAPLHSTTKSSFSFNTNTAPAQPAQKKEETPASGGSLLSRLAPTNAVPQAPAQPVQSQPTFSFTSPAAAGPSATSHTQVQPVQAQPIFSFTNPTLTGTNSAPQTPAQSVQPQPTFSFTNPVAGASNAAAQSAAQPAQPPSIFSFTKPATAELAKSTPTFANTSQTTSAQPASAPTSTSTAAPKFSFGFGNKPANTSPAPAPAPGPASAPTHNPFISTTSSLSGALGHEMESKPAATAFSLKVSQAPQAPTQTTNSNFTTNPSSTPFSGGGMAAAPTFSFGQPSSSSGFGAQNAADITGSTTVPNTTSDTKPPLSIALASNPSPFGAFGGASSGLAPSSASTTFPSAIQTSANPAVAFGASSGQAPSSASTAFPNIIQSSTNTAASSFGFSNAFGGGSTPNPSATTAPTAEAPKSFSFGFTPGTTTTPKASEPPKASAFSFTANPSTPPATVAPKPSVFSFGATSMTPTTTFGGATTSGGDKTTPATSPFSFGVSGGNVASSSTNTPSTPGAGAFSFGDATKNPTQMSQLAGGQSAFGKTSSPSVFGFGSPTPTTTAGNANSFNMFGKAPTTTG